MKNLYVLDDEPEYVDYICELAREGGMAAEGGTSPDAFAAAFDDRWDVVVLDLQMPGSDGIEMLRRLAGKGCKARLVMISGCDPRVLHTACEVASALDLRVAGGISKPFVASDFLNLLDLPLAPRLRLRGGSSLVPSREDFEQALLKGDIVAHFQPKLDLGSGAFAGAEALARWTHPRLGVISPAVFVPLAEANGLAEALTETMLDQALATCRRWRARGRSGSVAVNVPVRCLLETSLPDRIEVLARRHDIPPAELTLEITESGMIEDISAALEVIARIRLKGFGLSIDDFGAGYSSLQQLRRAPFTELKIDQEFVRTAGSDAVSWQIVEKVVELGHQLGLKIVAEGIETRSQAALMTRMECDVGQGFHYARPMDAGALMVWLKGR